MATLNRTFSVKNGIDVANTIIIDSSRNLSNIVTANISTVNATTFITVAGLNLADHANNAYGQANAAYAQANASYGQANAAYGQANTARDTANGAYAQANGAYAQANGAYAQANGAFAQANGAYAQANGAYAQANGAYDQANTSANTVRVYANSANGLSNKFLNFTNTASIQVSVTDAGDGNANISFATTGAAVADAYAQANAAYGQANAAYSQANDAFAQANAGYAQANAGYAQANAAYGQANAAYSKANGAYNTANLKVASISVSGNGLAVSNVTSANINDYTISVNTASTTLRGTTLLVDSTSSTDTGNAATANAVNAVYEFANTKLSLTGGIVIGDVTVEGNLFVNGVQTIVNTESLTVNDPIFLLANNNTTNAVGLGIVAHYGPTQQHTGLVRAHQDEIWYLFQDYDDHILYANNILDVANVKLATLKANLRAESLNVSGGFTNIDSTLVVTGNTTLSNVTVNKDANVIGNLTVSGITIYSNVVTYTAAVNIDSTLTVSNTTNLVNTNVNGVLTITSSGEGLVVANANVTNTLTVSVLEITSNTVTTSSSGQVVLDKFPTTEYASTKYFVQAKSGSDYHTTEIVLVQDATNVWITE